MANHRACRGCMDGCTADAPKHCASCVNEPWPCDAERRGVEVERLNRLVDTVTRALMRYQEEEDAAYGGDDPVDHPYRRRGSWSGDDWCAVDGCTSRASAHDVDKVRTTSAECHLSRLER